MLTARAKEETRRGVQGVRFTTDVRPDTPDEGVLQKVQRELGPPFPSEDTTEAHLALVSVDSPNAASFSIITLWVPMTLRSRAEELLQAAGFTVSHMGT